MEESGVVTPVSSGELQQPLMGLPELPDEHWLMLSANACLIAQKIMAKDSDPFADWARLTLLKQFGLSKERRAQYLSAINAVSQAHDDGPLVLSTGAAALVSHVQQLLLEPLIAHGVAAQPAAPHHLSPTKSGLR